MELSGKVAEAHLIVEMDPLFNSTVGAFLKAGTVAAAKVAAEETYNAVRQVLVANRRECFAQLRRLGEPMNPASEKDSSFF